MGPLITAPQLIAWHSGQPANQWNTLLAHALSEFAADTGDEPISADRLTD